MELNDLSRQIMLRTPNQIYLAPCPALRGCIAHYTISFASDTTVPDYLTIIPDASGCLVFTYDGYSLTSLLWGATSRTVIVRNDVNKYPMRLFIEFLPGGLFYLTGLVQSQLTDLQLPVWQINSRLHSQVAAAFESSKSLTSFVNRLNMILLSVMRDRVVPPVLFDAIQRIRQQKGCLSVRELAAAEYYSEKHLNRLFNDYLGMSLKTFSDIVRINYVIQELNETPGKLGALAQTAGFYDQAHFIHTFKSICGTTPTKYQENMSEFYNEPFKF